jgi:histidinol-phosphate aminotransferase
MLMANRRVRRDAMSLSRRAFVQRLGWGGSATLSAGFIAARGREAWAAEGLPGTFEDFEQAATNRSLIRISSNENPLGPGPAAREAMLAAAIDSNRYPMNARASMQNLKATIARRYNAKPENVILGDGSSELLTNIVRVYTSASRPLINGSPSYLDPEKTANLIGSVIKHVPLTTDLKLDLNPMLAASKNAGLIFLCYPNNPTATAVPKSAVADFVGAVRKMSPAPAVLIDEAYIDYATDPSVGTNVDLALANPGVVVTRTFSKAFGMAGLRLGYAIGQAETLKAIDPYGMPNNANNMAIAAAIASLNDPAHLDEERKRNTAARAFTIDWFEKAGYKATESQANFIFVNIKRPSRIFREMCLEQGVAVGRDFPPMEKTHARISIGTMAEMHKAVEVFEKVLSAPAPTAI